MEVSFKKTIGKRKKQEDASFRGECGAYNFFVVSDGMGGMGNGEVVSDCVVNVFKDACKVFSDDFAIDSFFYDTLLNANEKVENLHTGGGATVLACVIKDNLLNWISVGDSPLLLFRNNKFIRLNQNHSNVFSSDVFAHSNLLTSCIMGNRIPLVDYNVEPFVLKENDFLIISTDGILDIEDVSADFLKNVLSNKNYSLSEKLDMVFDKLSVFQFMDNTTTFLLKF